MRLRPAPTAVRIATSRCRVDPRARSRFATFAHAISSTRTELRAEGFLRVRANGIELVVCARERQAGFQAADHFEELHGGRRPGRSWRLDDRCAIEIDLAGLHAAPRRRGRQLHAESGRQHTRDGRRPPIERDGVAEDARIAAEPAFEERVRQHDALFARPRHGSERGARAGEIPEPVGRRDDARLDHFIADVDPLAADEEAREAIERLRLIAPRHQVGGHHELLVRALLRGGDPDKTIGVGIRQRTHEHGVDDAEDRRRQADAERERQHHDGTERGRAADHAQAVAHVLHQLIEPDGDPDRARVFLRERDAAEPLQRRGARIVGRHAAVDVVRHLAFEVIADVRVEIVESLSFHTDQIQQHAGHYVTGLNTRAMALASLSHFDVSTASCFRPFGVSR